MSVMKYLNWKKNLSTFQDVLNVCPGIHFKLKGMILMSDIKADHYDDLLPEDSLPVMGLRMVSYLDKEGDIRFNYKPDGDVLITQLIGTLYWILQDITDKGRNTQD